MCRRFSHPWSLTYLDHGCASQSERMIYRLKPMVECDHHHFGIFLYSSDNFILYINVARILLCGRCAQEPTKWQRNSVNVSKDSVEGVLDWIYDFESQPAYGALCTTEALLEAAGDDQVHEVMRRANNL